MQKNDRGKQPLPKKFLSNGIQHILYEYTVAFSGVGYHNVGHRAYEVAVLDNGGARHECGQVGTTHFYKLLTFFDIIC